jgi:hypothetical protein
MAGNRPLGFVYENTRAGVLPGAAKAELRLHIIWAGSPYDMRMQRGDTLRNITARRFREKLEGVKNGKQQDPH